MVEGEVSIALSKPISLSETADTPAPRDDEGALVEACKRGERPAMHTFYERYRRRVFALIARIVGSQDAEELSQEVFLRAFRGLDKFRGDAQLSTWMYRLAVNAALSHATRAQARARRSVSDEILEEVAAPSGEAADPRLRERLQTAMADLPAGYRAVLVLHDIEGLQHEEIAQILGCRVGTSKSQLHKARAKMREMLSGVER